MEKKVGFKLHKVRKTGWLLKLLRCRWLRVDPFLDQSAVRWSVTSNGDGFEQTDEALSQVLHWLMKAIRQPWRKMLAICQGVI